MSNIRIAITLGDPAGIGPEVALKALQKWKNPHKARVLLLGPAEFYLRLARKLKLDLPPLNPLLKQGGEKSVIANFPSPYFRPEADPPQAERRGLGRGDAVDWGSLDNKIVYGRSVQNQTIAAVRSIELAVKLAMKGEVDAIVTPPINKAGLKKAGFNIPGHTEYLAKLSNTKRFEMMLVGGKLRTALVTRHTPIKEVAKKITAERVEEVILLTIEELKRSFGIKKPKIVVCGLNPHAGEEGTIGREELEEIIPGVRRAIEKAKNAKVIGPLSPDALFSDAYQGKYDAEVCMYHDQGLIPLKMISRGFGVNVTLGLPFVRTSPDHGTAYDIASKFIADPGSMIEALNLAVTLSMNRKKGGVA